MNKLKTIYLIAILGYLLSAFTYKVFAFNPLYFNGLGFLVTGIIIWLSKPFLKKLLQIKTLHFFGISFFLFFIAIPLTHQPNNNKSNENRNFASFPEFNISNPWKFTRNLISYFEDDFAFRSSLVELNSNIKLNYLKTSPSPQSICIEKKGWAYLREPQYLHETSRKYSEEELNQLVGNIKATKAFFDQYNIKYYLVITPIKPRIYPEYLTDHYKKRFRYSALNQIKNAFKNDDFVIDIRPNLLKNKKKGTLYYQTDTHWNRLGAFWAYETIIKTIKKDFPDIDPINLSDLKVDSMRAFSGDLNKVMGDDRLMERTVIGIEYEERKAQLDCTNVPYYNNVVVKAPFMVLKNPKGKRKMLMFRDSYTQYLYKPLSEHFEKSVYSWRPTINVGLVKYEKPDIIIQENLERFVDDLMVLPPEIEQFKKENNL